MKKSNYLAVFTIVLIIVLAACSKDEQKPKGIFNLSFSRLSSENQLKSANNDSVVPKFVVISIKNSSGNYILNAKKLELIKLGDSYFTKNIELEEGDYTVDDFLVLDSSSSTIYLTPKIGSDFEELVSTPLPYSFHISTSKTNNVILDVISSDLGEADQYGYATFSFNIVKGLIIRPDSSNGNDASISKIVPDKNYGDSPEMHLYAWTQGGILNINRIAIEFDLSAIPSNVTIDSAFIGLYFDPTSTYRAINPEDNYGDDAFVIERIIEPWQENTITWNNQPATTTDNQVYVPDDPNDREKNFMINVTQLVKDSREKPDSSYGFMVKYADESIYKITYFTSSEYPDKSKRPMLKVYFH